MRAWTHFLSSLLIQNCRIEPNRGCIVGMTALLETSWQVGGPTQCSVRGRVPVSVGGRSNLDFGACESCGRRWDKVGIGAVGAKPA